MEEKTETIPVLGVPLYARDIPTAVEKVRAGVEAASEDETRLISATGAHGLVYAQQHPDFMELLNRFYMNLPDGKPGVWVGRWKGGEQMDRCYGPRFFEELLRATAEDSTRHYLCGGAEGVPQELRRVCVRRFGNRKIVGVHSPPFRPLTGQEFKALGREIDASGADIVWIGISTPKQEQFAAQLAEHTTASFIITVGAAFDFHIGAVRQAPDWMQRAGLEWLFRFLMEPRRLFGRVMRVIPGFIYYNLKEFTMGRFFKEKVSH